MQEPDVYCDECGGANDRSATHCFACQRPLTLPATHECVNLPGWSVTPGLVQIQVDFSSGLVHTIQLPPAPKPAALLHNRYEILNRVGMGGFSAVYKARDTHRRDRLVAIKAIELNTLSTSQTIEATDTFNRELGLLSTLEHKNLLRIYEHFSDSTHWYLVMDFIDGEPLDAYLQQIVEGCLPLKEVMNIALQLCDVLDYLHHLQPPIIFRDVKPANILLTPGGQIYLIDFGIARRFKPGQAKDTTPLGSPGFAAPEQYGRAQTTPRSDIYSLGVTLYVLLTGYNPANTPFNLPPVYSLCPGLHRPLAELITEMLALDPLKRPGSVAAVHEVLLRYAPLTRRTTTLASRMRSSQPASQATPVPAIVSAPLPVSTRSSRFGTFIKKLLSAMAIHTI